MYWRHAHDGWGAGHWVFGGLMMVLIVAAIVALVMLVVRRPVVHAGPPVDGRFLPPAPPTAEAERILAERFARGEIDEAEFVSRRAALRSSP